MRLSMVDDVCLVEFVLFDVILSNSILSDLI